MPERVTTLVVAPAVPPVLRGGRLRQNAELGNRFDRQLQRVTAIHAVDVLRAVDQIHVLLGPHAIDGIRLALTETAAGRGDAERQRGDTRLQQAELCEVAAVQWQIDELAASHDTAERIARRVHERRLPRDLHRFGNRRQVQLDVQPNALTDADVDRLADHRRETRGLHREPVSANGKREHPIEAVSSGLGFFRESRFEIGDDDARAADSGGRAIADRPFDRTGRVLRARVSDGKHRQDQRGDEPRRVGTHEASEPGL